MEMRQGLVTWLNDRGCPVSVSDKPENRVAAFLVSNHDHHGGLKHIWHGEGIEVSAYTPRSPEHAPLHDLDGNLPTLDAIDFDEWMSEAEFRLVKPSDENGTRRSARGSHFDDNFEPNEYGAAFAQTIADRWAFDYDHGGYHRWNGLHWRNLVDRDAEDILWGEVIDSEPVQATRRSLQHGREAVLKAVRRGIGREMLFLAGEWLATGNQMVNLRTSEFRPFDPSIDHHRAVTGGCYRDDWQNEHCWSILWGRTATSTWAFEISMPTYLGSSSISTSCVSVGPSLQDAGLVGPGNCSGSLRGGCGDPRYKTVFHDQGATGLPHPGPPE